MGLLDLIIAELNRLEGYKHQGRPQTNIKNIPHPLSPSNVEGIPRVHHNRHMIASMLPVSGKDMKTASPFKIRFATFKDEQKIRDPSPVKFVERRFSKENEEIKQNTIHQGSRIKVLTEMLLFLYRLLNSIS